MMLTDLRRLFKESLIYGFSGVVSRFVTIFLVPIYTRIFSPEDYGVISLVTTTMALIGLFVILALDSAAGRWYWETEDKKDRQVTLASWAWCQFGVSILFCAGILFWAVELGEWIVGRQDAAPYFRLSAFALPMSVLGFLVTNWLRMQRRPWSTTFFGLGTSLFNIILTIVFVVIYRWGISGIFYAQLYTAIVSTIIAAFLLRGWIHPIHVRLSRLMVMLKFALPLIPAALSFWIVNSANRYFIQSYATTGEVGLFQVGSSIAAVLALATGAFQQAWGPFALSIHRQDDARLVYANVLLAYIWISCLGASAMALFGSEAILLLATKDYLGANTVLGLLSLSYVFIGLGFIASIGPTIMKTSAPTGFALAMAAILNIALNWCLVPLWGKTGSAVATLISQAITPVYLFYRSQQLYPIPYRFWPVILMVALALVYAVIGALWQISELSWMGILVKLLLIAFYVPLAFGLHLVTPAQARQIWHSIPGIRKCPV